MHSTSSIWKRMKHLFSPSYQKNDPSEGSATHNSENRNIEDVIQGYFDKRKWKYHMHTDENSTIRFKLGFTANNEKVFLDVNIFPHNKIYEINCHSETKLPQELVYRGIAAINNYNLSARVVSGCVSPNGDIIFWLGRNIDGNTFSEEAFAIDFEMVIRETDYETAQIYKQSHINNPELPALN